MADSPANAGTLGAALARESPTPVLVGLSGGLDSTVLLHALARLPAQRNAGLRAIHVHHGLHASADAWAEHCARLCADLDLPLSLVRVDVERGAGKGLESAARAARYGAFAAQLHAGEVLATAHHLDDQAETFLLRALRASGPDGLASMQEWRQFRPGQHHWRPLLSLRRDELLAHARLHDMRWIEDPSNADPSLDRNFLRLHVMPVLRQRWPHADAALARSAALSGDAIALLGNEDARALAMAATLDPHVLHVAPLLALPSSRLARVLRLWVSNLQLPSLPGSGVHQVATDLLHAATLREPLPLGWEVHWSGSQPLALPGGGTLTLQGDACPPVALIAHARRGGERIRLPGRSHSHSLKHVLQDLGVPPWERVRLPLLSNGEGQLLAAGDLVYSADFDHWLRGNQARLVWRDAA